MGQYDQNAWDSKARKRNYKFQNVNFLESFYFQLESYSREKENGRKLIKQVRKIKGSEINMNMGERGRGWVYVEKLFPDRNHEV